jgi:hypothetical protein
MLTVRACSSLEKARFHFASALLCNSEQHAGVANASAVYARQHCSTH